MKALFSFFPVSFREKIIFLIRTRYFPYFNKPKTYNQKINHRKLFWKNPLFSICSDKIAVKDYVRQKIGDKYVIENVFTGNNIQLSELQDLLEVHGNLVVKANHNSGPIHFVDNSLSKNELEKICQNVNGQLKKDYGKYKNELWYSEFTPAVLVEKRIFSKNGGELWDYKFHVFRGNSHNEQTVVLHIDYDRNKFHNRSFFDEDLNWLPFSTKKFPCLKTKIEKPENYEDMVFIAKSLARPFSYARIDLYNVDGNIFFGEITFAPGSGRSRFSSFEYDYWLGSLWKGDPAS